MDKNLTPFWEEVYQKENTAAFSLEPNATVKEYEHLLNTRSRILDIGCGEGQNALYFARQGYRNVEAFDLSEQGIEKLRRRCQREKILLNAFVADLRTYPFEKSYDMVMSFGTLHFVEKADWKAMIDRAKAHTGIGGIHMMQIFTDTVPASQDIAPFAVGLAKDGELRECYEDWEILQFKSYVFEDEHPGVPKHLHASNKIIARKLL